MQKKLFADKKNYSSDDVTIKVGILSLTIFL